MDNEIEGKQRARPSSGVYVYRRKRDELIRWVVEHRPGFGKPKSYRVFETRTDAEVYAAELRGALKVASTTIETKATVEDAWFRYKQQARMTLRPGALETYAGSMAKHILPAIGHVPISELDRARVRKLIDDLLAAGVNPKTVKNAIGALRSTLGRLVDDGLIPSNPASIQKGWIPTRHPEPKSLSTMQLREFLAAAKGEAYETLVYFLAMTGVRLGEALALQWTSVDLEGRTARITRSVRLKRESQPKTRFGMRSIDLPNAIVRMLQVLPSRDKHELVFCQRDGSFLNARHIHHVFSRIARRAGLPPIHPHMLRHTWATRMIGLGLPLNYVSRALGHHSTAFTAGVYATAHPEPRHEDVDRFASLVILNETSESPGTMGGEVGDEGALLDLDPVAHPDPPKQSGGDHPVDGPGVDAEPEGDLGRDE